MSVEDESGLSQMRGHFVRWNGSDWRYVDDNSLVTAPRPCALCRQPCALGEPDPCLGFIPGVRGACCGHGVMEGYILYHDGRRLALPLLPSDLETLEQRIAREFDAP